MIKIIKSLKIKFVTSSTHLKLIFFIFSTNEKKYVKHNNTCARRRHNVKKITKKRTWKSQAQLDSEKIFSNFYLI